MLILSTVAKLHCARYNYQPDSTLLHALHALHALPAGLPGCHSVSQAASSLRCHSNVGANGLFSSGTMTRKCKSFGADHRHNSLCVHFWLVTTRSAMQQRLYI